MKLEHFGMAEPGDCRVVFSASAAELEAAVQAEQAAPDAPADEEELLTNAVNRAILEGFSPLFAQLMEEHHLTPVTDPDFELLAVNRAEGFRAGAEFFCLPPLELGRYTGFIQPIQPRPIRKLTLELPCGGGWRRRSTGPAAHRPRRWQSGSWSTSWAAR